LRARPSASSSPLVPVLVFFPASPEPVLRRPATLVAVQPG
jgi:hypothetical protein